MSYRLLNILTSFIKRVDAELYGPDAAMPRYPATPGMSTIEAWDAVPVFRRGMEWDAEGRLFIHEVKKDPVSGLKVRITREIVG